MLKAVLVGVGGMGSWHFHVYKNMKDVELTAVCDVRMDMLKEKTAGMDIKLYSKIEIFQDRFLTLSFTQFWEPLSAYVLP